MMSQEVTSGPTLDPAVSFGFDFEPFSSCCKKQKKETNSPED